MNQENKQLPKKALTTGLADSGLVPSATPASAYSRLQDGIRDLVEFYDSWLVLGRGGRPPEGEDCY